MEIKTIKIEKPEPVNFILGQSHFIKTVEDMHETLVTCVPGIKFGLAFCEASGDCLVRWTGTDEAMIELARTNALAIGAGHSFILFLAEGFYPINVLNAIKMIPEVARVFCATANPTEVLIAETEQGGDFNAGTGSHDRPCRIHSQQHDPEAGRGENARAGLRFPSAR